MLNETFSDNTNNDGKPCEVKVSCTVWSGGKSGDDFKGLPIAIFEPCHVYGEAFLVYDPHR